MPSPPPNGSYMCFVGVFLISWIWFLVENFGKKERMKKVALWCSNFLPPPRSSKSEGFVAGGGMEEQSYKYKPLFSCLVMSSHIIILTYSPVKEKNRKTHNKYNKYNKYNHEKEWINVIICWTQLSWKRVYTFLIKPLCINMCSTRQWVYCLPCWQYTICTMYRVL